MIIGLPGSGKTYLLDSYEGQFIYDDEVPNLSYNGFYNSVIDNDVYLADPRLCYYPTFKRIINRLPPSTLNSMKIILFENDPGRCIKNVVNDKRIRDIITYSRHYDHTIDKIINGVYQYEFRAIHHNNH